MWKEPLHTNYRGYDVYSSPPTSRGGMEVLMQLNLIEGFDIAELGQNSAETLHLVIEAIKVARRTSTAMWRTRPGSRSRSRDSSRRSTPRRGARS